jgi:hypothetical protein
VEHVEVVGGMETEAEGMNHMAPEVEGMNHMAPEVEGLNHMAPEVEGMNHMAPEVVCRKSIKLGDAAKNRHWSDDVPERHHLGRRPRDP